MKTLQKLGFIYTISVVGMILLFIVVKADWFRVDTVFERVVAVVVVLVLTIIAGQYSWSGYQKNTRV